VLGIIALTNGREYRQGDLKFICFIAITLGLIIFHHFLFDLALDLLASFFAGFSYLTASA